MKSIFIKWRYYLLITNLVILFPFCSFSQKDTTLAYRFTINPIQLFYNEIPITIEKSFPKYTLGVLLAVKYSTQQRGEIFNKGGLGSYYCLQTYHNDMYNALTFGFSSKYYPILHTPFFMESVLFYRYWWFNNKDCFYGGAGSMVFDGIRTERQHVYGIKFLLGHSIVLDRVNRIKFLLDFFAGVGFRFKAVHFETFNGIVNDKYYTYHLEKELHRYPSVHLGIRFGFGLRKPYTIVQ